MRTREKFGKVQFHPVSYFKILIKATRVSFANNKKGRRVAGEGIRERKKRDKH